ncbi:hypothetical protein Pan97_20700 [Bremerella volcania]|uniref:Serine protease n=1 Tax=Bremerella volcania TaxID=2527984 RepID=A0A518C748_9BACT|nr:serine protease [Bremerella volcania]QDU75049.1 hypothetical protein Pan97_20700 [Bremerella volcania]
MSQHYTGPQLGEIQKAINSAGSIVQIGHVLSYKLNDQLQNHDHGNGAADTLFNLLHNYNCNFDVDSIVLAMLEKAPNNKNLLDVAWKHNIVNRPPGSQGKRAPDDDSLQRLLDPKRGFTDPVEFYLRWGKLLSQVCRIEVPTSDGDVMGSGLLVGNETVITNYHVMHDVINETRGAKRDKVRVLFDEHPKMVNRANFQGKKFSLVNNDSWLIDSSPYDEADLQLKTLTENCQIERPSDHLDYALLRIDGSPGSQKILDHEVAGGEDRGYCPFPADPAATFADDFDPQDAWIHVFQYPNGESLQMDSNKPGVTGIDRNKTRIMHSVNALPGSSGAPLFNAKLELIGIHQAGAKDWPADKEMLYNQGIPIAAVRELLVSRNKLDQIK